MIFNLWTTFPDPLLYGMQPACLWEINRYDYKHRDAVTGRVWLQYWFHTEVFVHSNIRDRQMVEGREGGNVLFQLIRINCGWKSRCSPGNNPNEVNLFKDSYIGFPRATLLREGTISFDFLVACIRSSCVINKLTQHLQLRLTQCQWAVSDWHAA